MDLKKIFDELSVTYDQIAEVMAEISDAIVADEASAGVTKAESEAITAEAKEVPTQLAPAAPNYVSTQKLLDTGYALEQFIEKGWGFDDLLAADYVIIEEKEPVEEVEPEPEVAPAPPAAPEAAPEAPAEPTMTALAKGATYDQFVKNGWSDAQMLDAGYIESVTVQETADLKKDLEEMTWPFQNEDGTWTDKDGTTHDPDKHAESGTKGNPPPVTSKGVFKKTRKKAKTAAPKAPVGGSTATEGPGAPPIHGEDGSGIEGAPGAPLGSPGAEGGAPMAPGSTAPDAPGAPGAPDAPGGAAPEEEDEELEDLLKDFNSTAS